jgi:hypothetical protein
MDSVPARDTLQRMPVKFNQLRSSKVIANSKCTQGFEIVVVGRHLDSPFAAEETFAQKAFLSFSRPR